MQMAMVHLCSSLFVRAYLEEMDTLRHLENDGKVESFLWRRRLEGTVLELSVNFSLANNLEVLCRDKFYQKTKFFVISF